MVFATIVLMALLAADAWLTVAIIRAGGLEMNPIVRWFIAKLGLLPGLTVSRAIVLVLAVLWPSAIWALIGAYAAVVLWNWRQWRKGR